MVTLCLTEELPDYCPQWLYPQNCFLSAQAPLLTSRAPPVCQAPGVPIDICTQSNPGMVFPTPISCHTVRGQRPEVRSLI